MNLQSLEIDPTESESDAENITQEDENDVKKEDGSTHGLPKVPDSGKN